MTHRASGTFEVKLEPLSLDDKGAARTLGRLSIRKTFHGGLEATSRGEMLSALTAVQGSAGYVAIEHVTGTLDGRAGSFVLQHTGTMDQGKQSLTVTVVPDSGTDALTGISGVMTITIEGKRHSYELAYALPVKQAG
jgi:hypothetical protein